MKAKKAIIVGASSGIGCALAQVLARRGYALGLTARRIELLKSLEEEIGGTVLTRFMDVRCIPESVSCLEEMIRQMKGVDWVILNAGVNPDNPGLDWNIEADVLHTNTTAFAALADVTVRHFLRQGSGHLAGISSIAGLRGSAMCPAYSASKAAMSNYLESLRFRLASSAIHITDIRPGFVETPMIARSKIKFWAVSSEEAAGQIVKAMELRKKVAYVPKRWGPVAWIYRRMPAWVLERIYQWASRL